MLFNSVDTLSLTAIREATEIPEAELRRHLLSLCTPKFRILNKSTTAKGIADNEVFTFNDKYTSKLRRVKIPLVVAKDSGGLGDGGDGLAALPASVEEDRRHMIEATIVRIMKARKTMSHNDLIAESMRQCAHRFTPDAQVRSS
jgi:cullin 3